MNSQLEYLLYGAGYFIKTKLFRLQIPFIGGLVLNESCNLNCIQCRVANRDLPDLSYLDAKRGLSAFYRMGIRSVFIEGGEPFLWRDGELILEDVIHAARNIGFKVVSIYTNGTLPIRTSADTVFVSLDGLKETNNRLRGNGYDRVIANIQQSPCPNICINYTINRLNRGEIEAFCREMLRISNIRGVFFCFHTPYYGTDELFLPLTERRTVIREILALKKRGFRILNSSACLKTVFRDDWKRPSKLCYVYAQNTLYQCCRAIGTPEVCAECGYLGYPEIVTILRLNPSAIISALHYLPRSI